MANNKKPKTISNTKWIILFVLTGAVDIFQFLAGLTVAGIALSEVIEPYVGVCLLAICQLMKINVITKPKRVASILASFGLDAVSGGFAPLWILDVWYIYYDTKKEEAVAMKAYRDSQASTQGEKQYTYEGGRREPNITNSNQPAVAKPAVVDGVRAPSR